MLDRTHNFPVRLIVSGIAVVFATWATPVIHHIPSLNNFEVIASAHAEGDSEGTGGHKGGKGVKGSGGSGDHGSGGEKGQKDVLTHGPANSRGDYSADGKGPRAKSGDSGTRGTRPVWAKEGVTVELGRLNMTRAPQSVRDRQLAEALKSITDNPALMDVYKLSIDQFTADLTKDTVRIDAPLESLAIYQAFVKALAANPAATSVTLTAVNKETGVPMSVTFNLKGSDSTTQATASSVLGILLGTAADKDPTKIGGLDPKDADGNSTGIVVESINKILGVTSEFNAAGLSTATVAQDAEAVRDTIYTVHEE
ncbi:MAG TPA: hypothetical protein VF811_01000 [Parasulfuritortus sp.]